MRNDELLEQIYNDVKALGLVEDQWTFSNMCGRTGTWFSCIKNRNLPMTSTLLGGKLCGASSYVRALPAQ